MKNKFLLLGATALLSTGAIGANATDPMPSASTSVGVNAELVEIRAVKTDSDLSFGRVAFMNFNGEHPMNFIELTIDKNGLTSVSDLKASEGAGQGDIETYVLTQGTRGVVRGATCAQLDYPGKDDQYGTTFVAIDTMPVGAGASDAWLNNLHCNTVNNTAVFYGKFIVEPSVGAVVPGTYSGSFTVTLINNEDED